MALLALLPALARGSDTAHFADFAELREAERALRVRLRDVRRERAEAEAAGAPKLDAARLQRLVQEEAGILADLDSAVGERERIRAARRGATLEPTRTAAAPPPPGAHGRKRAEREAAWAQALARRRRVRTAALIGGAALLAALAFAGRDALARLVRPSGADDKKVS